MGSDYSWRHQKSIDKCHHLFSVVYDQKIYLQTTKENVKIRCKRPFLIQINGLMPQNFNQTHFAIIQILKIQRWQRKFKKQNKKYSKNHIIWLFRTIYCHCADKMALECCLITCGLLLTQEQPYELVFNQSLFQAEQRCQIHSMFHSQHGLGFSPQPQHVRQLECLDYPFMLQNDCPLLFSPLFPLTAQNSLATSERWLGRQAYSRYSPQMRQGSAVELPFDVDSEQVVTLGTIIKNKIIQKSAKRPTTYLTERKYYLSQPHPDQQNTERKLRPRKIKKKNHRKADSSASIGPKQQNVEKKTMENQEAGAEVDLLQKFENQSYLSKIIEVESQSGIHIKMEGGAASKTVLE